MIPPPLANGKSRRSNAVEMRCSGDRIECSAEIGFKCGLA
jgi:hypothetical protein